MSIQDFISMSDIDKCDFINKHLENHTPKTFKQGDVNFTFRQAEKVLSDCGIYKLEGIYRTSEQALEFIERKKKEQERKNFTPEQLERLMQLVSCDGFENLIKLADEYNYVSRFILNEKNDIQIQAGDGEVKQTTIRIYKDTWIKWQSYVATQKNFSGLNLLNTALVEFMNHHRI